MRATCCQAITDFLPYLDDLSVVSPLLCLVTDSSLSVTEHALETLEAIFLRRKKMDDAIQIAVITKIIDFLASPPVRVSYPFNLEAVLHINSPISKHRVWSCIAWRWMSWRRGHL